jgi:hypothetical protein
LDGGRQEIGGEENGQEVEQKRYRRKHHSERPASGRSAAIAS